MSASATFWIFLLLQEAKVKTKTDKMIRIIFLLFMHELLNMNFVFITKQGFFIFLDKLSKVNLIEVKKVLIYFWVGLLSVEL